MTLWIITLLTGCAPDLDEAREEASQAYCDRAEECGWVDDEEGREDCLDGAEEVMESLWPSDECEEQIDREEWLECIDGMAEIDCDSWDLGVGDVFKFCEPDDVCQG